MDNGLCAMNFLTQLMCNVNLFENLVKEGRIRREKLKESGLGSRVSVKLEEKMAGGI